MYEEFRKHCRMVDALAFLPLQLVLEGMTYLKNNLPENITDVFDQFDAYYVKKLVGQKYSTIWKLIRKIKNEFLI